MEAKTRQDINLAAFADEIIHLNLYDLQDNFRF